MYIWCILGLYIFDVANYYCVWPVVKISQKKVKRANRGDPDKQTRPHRWISLSQDTYLTPS